MFHDPGVCGKKNIGNQSTRRAYDHARRASGHGLPTGEYTKEANKLGGHPVHPIQLEWAEPGVKMGQ
jgi:hypothetical protein